MLQGKTISIIIPCHNEEEGLRYMLAVCPSFIDEVIVVDNDSTDKTADVARNWNAKVVFLKARGYGLAYQKGIDAACGDILLGLDGDGTYPVSDIEKLVRKITDENYDFVSGSRFPLIQKKSMPLIKQISNQLYSAWLRYRFKIALRDSQSGMFAFKRRDKLRLVPNCSGMPFSQKIKLNAWLAPELRATEVFIGYDLRHGEVKYRVLQDSWANLWDALRTYLPKG